MNTRDSQYEIQWKDDKAETGRKCVCPHQCCDLHSAHNGLSSEGRLRNVASADGRLTYL